METVTQASLLSTRVGGVVAGSVVGVLGKIVVHAQHVAAVVRELLAHRHAGVRRDVLQRR